jgi:hypothetical protein
MYPPTFFVAPSLLDTDENLFTIPDIRASRATKTTVAVASHRVAAV